MRNAENFRKLVISFSDQFILRNKNVFRNASTIDIISEMYYIDTLVDYVVDALLEKKLITSKDIADCVKIIHRHYLAPIYGGCARCKKVNAEYFIVNKPFYNF